MPHATRQRSSDSCFSRRHTAPHAHGPPRASMRTVPSALRFHLRSGSFRRVFQAVLEGLPSDGAELLPRGALVAHHRRVTGARAASERPGGSREARRCAQSLRTPPPQRRNMRELIVFRLGPPAYSASGRPLCAFERIGPLPALYWKTPDGVFRQGLGPGSWLVR